MSDREVRIGDRHQVGNALFEVTQPRVTRYRVGIREVQAGGEITLVASAPEGLSVFEVNAPL